MEWSNIWCRYQGKNLRKVLEVGSNFFDWVCWLPSYLECIRVGSRVHTRSGGAVPFAPQIPSFRACVKARSMSSAIMRPGQRMLLSRFKGGTNHLKSQTYTLETRILTVQNTEKCFA